MDRPSLSIVIPSHNRPDLLRECLARVLQHKPSAAEVIVVDDGSPHRQASDVAARFGVPAVRLECRRGFCAAANTGVAASRGQVVELLNDDTEVAAGWAEAALAWFARPEVAAVAPLVLRWPDGKTIDSAGDRYYLGGVARKRGHGQPITSAYSQAQRVFGASACAAFYRREALLKVGAFPESFGAYFEDVDLAFRFQRAGYRTMFEPASRVLHHVSASHGSPRRALLEQQSRNEERVFWRNTPSAALWRALPRHLAVLAGKAWRRGREGNLIPFLVGRLRLLADIGDLVRHRRQVAALGACPGFRAWSVETSYWA